jgi:hypothetical protein
LQQVTKIVKEEFPNSTVHAYGSIITGLELPCRYGNHYSIICNWLWHNNWHQCMIQRRRYMCKNPSRAFYRHYSVQSTPAS